MGHGSEHARSDAGQHLRRTPWDRVHGWLVLGLLCLLPLQAWASARTKSPTFDEPYHIATGYATWVEGVQRWELFNPSLARRWIALPLLALRPRLPSGVTNQGELAYRFAFQNEVPPDRLFGWSRAMVLVPALWLALGVHLWSRALFGTEAGLLSLACIVVDPNVLAHAGLATTDVFVSASFFWTVFFFWRLRRRPNVWTAVWTGILLGIALTAKHTSLVLVPALVLLWLAAVPALDHRRWPVLGLTVLIVAAAFVFCESGLERISLADFANEQLAIQNRPSAVDLPFWMHVRLPFVRYLYGVWSVFSRYSGERTTFLYDRILTGGSSLYLPISFLLKTPLPTLALLAWSLVPAGRRAAVLSRPKASQVLLYLGLPPALYSAMVCAGRITLGYRFLLPVLPFVYVGIGSLAAVVPRPRARRARLALGVLVAWLAVASLLTHPHYLAFFSLVAGGPAGGYRYLVGSNLDWGQELVALSAYQRTHQTGRIHLAYFGSADPAAYGVDYACLPGLGLLDCPEAELPAKGWVAVSASCLQGICTSDPDFYASLRAREPAAILGHAMFLYELP